jgi:16S rRNA processing protein RimM
MPNERKLVIVGKVLSAHGVKGAVNIVSYTEPASNLFSYSVFDQAGEPFKITKHSHKNNDVFICSVEGINDRDQAQIMSGKLLYADRAGFAGAKADEYYINDLVGLPVYSDEGIYIGEVLDVVNYGASDILEISLGGDQRGMLPFIDNYVLEVDLKNGKIIINDEGIV